MLPTALWLACLGEAPLLLSEDRFPTEPRRLSLLSFSARITIDEMVVGGTGRSPKDADAWGARGDADRVQGVKVWPPQGWTLRGTMQEQDRGVLSGPPVAASGGRAPAEALRRCRVL